MKYITEKDIEKQLNAYKVAIYKLLKDLFEDASVIVNGDNMELYDESPDYAIDHNKVMNKLDEFILNHDLL